jgi:hypothetical protein
MSNGIDPLKDIFHLSDEEKQALQTATSIIGSVSSVWGTVSGTVNTAKSVLTTLGVLSTGNQADQVAEMRHYIDLLKLAFDGAVAALDKEKSMRDVADQLESARTQLDNLSEFAPEDASTVGIDPTWDGLRPFVLNNSLQAVNTLGDPAYWRRVYFPELVYQKWPPHRLNPEPVVDSDSSVPSGLVFDYRLTLPAYLEAISIRLTILVAVVKNYQSKAIPELTNMVNTLEGYFKQIRQSIWWVMAPPSDAVDSSDNPAGGVPTWLANGALVGAVEIYSACDRVAPWPQNEFPLVNFPGGGTGTPDTVTEWYKFLVRYSVRNWVRWKQLYDITGLNAVAETIITLKRMAGIDPATLPDPDVDPAKPSSYTPRKIRGGEYSIKELARMMHDIASTQWGAWPILSDAQGGLVNPISLREVLGLLQTYRPGPYTSFREALRQ